MHECGSLPGRGQSSETTQRQRPAEWTSEAEPSLFLVSQNHGSGDAVVRRDTEDRREAFGSRPRGDTLRQSLEVSKTTRAQGVPRAKAAHTRPAEEQVD